MAWSFHLTMTLSFHSSIYVFRLPLWYLLAVLGRIAETWCTLKCASHEHKVCHSNITCTDTVFCFVFLFLFFVCFLLCIVLFLFVCLFVCLFLLLLLSCILYVSSFLDCPLLIVPSVFSNAYLISPLTI